MSSIHMPPQGPGDALLSPASKPPARSARQNWGSFLGLPFRVTDSLTSGGNPQSVLEYLTDGPPPPPGETLASVPSSSSRPHLKGEHSVGANPNDPRGHHPTTREGACPSAARPHPHLAESRHLEPEPAGPGT